MQTNNIDLSGRVAVVTGAARGIGYAIAERLLRSGAAVSMWDVDTAALRAAGQALSPLGRVAVEQADVTDENAVQRASHSTVQRFIAMAACFSDFASLRVSADSGMRRTFLSGMPLFRISQA